LNLLGLGAAVGVTTLEDEDTRAWKNRKDFTELPIVMP
jgi:hypothetical protein